MNKHSTIFESIMDTSAYKVLHRMLKNYPNQVFGITDQELDDIIEYDVLRIISSYHNILSLSQEKYIVELLESEMGFVNISFNLEMLSEPMKDVVYIPYLLKLVKRLNVNPLVRASYQVLFKYCANLTISRMNQGGYVHDYLKLLNSAYFYVIADRLGISEYFSRYMKDGYGYCDYEDLVEHLYEKNSNNIDWDLDIDLDVIYKFLEDNANANVRKETKLGEDFLGSTSEYFEIINKIAYLRGNEIIQNRIIENRAELSAILRDTGICIIERAVISGFDCCFCRSDDYCEEYVIIFRQSSFYRLIVHDNKCRERFLEELYNAIKKLDIGIEPVHIIFIKDEAEPDYPDDALRSDSRSFPRYAFSKRKAISFLLDIDKRFIKHDDGYRLYVEDNRWVLYDSLYVPYIKIVTVKYGLENVSKIDLKVVFYESGNKKLWAESADRDTDSDKWKALGLIRVSTFYADQGYEYQKSIFSLPPIYAEIFVNDEFYEQVPINCSYEQIQKEVLLLKSFDSRINELYDRKTQKPFLPVAKAKHWTESNGLYVPFIEIDVINQEREPANFISVEAIFYDVSNRNLWSFSYFPLVISGCTPLKQGYRKTAFLTASVGYEDQDNIDSLPDITAEIYINSEFYGTITIDRSYEYTEYELPLTEKPVSINNDYVRVNNKDFYPVVRQNQWKKNSDIYAPFLQLDIINQQEECADQLDLDIYFYNLRESEFWGCYTVSILPTNVTLRPGFNISAFIKGPVGYSNMLEEEDLPDLFAFVFINTVSYGIVKIKKTYENSIINEALTMFVKGEEKQSIEAKVWNKKSFLGDMGYSTRKPEDERHEILNNAVREYDKQRIVEHISFLVNMRLAQENGAEKYEKAIKIWKEDLAYVRSL